MLGYLMQGHFAPASKRWLHARHALRSQSRPSDELEGLTQAQGEAARANRTCKATAADALCGAGSLQLP